MSDIVRTTVSVSEVNTPVINANRANIGKLSLNDVENLQAKEAFIENLTIKELTVLESDSNSHNTEKSETFEESTFNEVILNFADQYNCVYTTANHNILESAEDCKLLNITFDIPSEMGAKMVCRYLVLDLRKEPVENVVATVWNNAE